MTSDIETRLKALAYCRASARHDGLRHKTQFDESCLYCRTRHEAAEKAYQLGQASQKEADAKIVESMLAGETFIAEIAAEIRSGKGDE